MGGAAGKTAGILAFGAVGMVGAMLTGVMLGGAGTERTGGAEGAD